MWPNEELQLYISHLAKEKESLIAKYLDETGLKPSEVVLVQRSDANEIRLFPAEKTQFDATIEERTTRALKAADRFLRSVRTRIDHFHRFEVQREENELLDALEGLK